MANYQLFQTSVKPSSEFSLTQSGWQICDPSYFYGPAVRDQYLIHYIVGGKGRFIKEDASYNIAAGQGFLICPGELTTYQADGADPWEYVWVGFSGTNAKDYLALCGLSKASPVFTYTRNFTSDDCLYGYFDRINKLDKSTISFNFAGLGLLHMIFSELIIDKSPDKKFHSSDLVKQATAYIEQNYASNISVEDIAGMLFINRSHLFKLFIGKLGVSPVQYLINYRLYKSCEFLRHSNITVTNIASAAGFSDSSHFCRLFKKKFGVSPLGYRKVPFETE